MNQLFIERVPEIEVRTLHSIVQIVLRLAFFLKTIEVFVVENAKLVILITDYLGQIINWEGATGSWNDIPRKICIRQSFLHHRDLLLRQIESIKYNSITYALHTVLNQELIVVLILIHVKVLRRHLCHDKLDIKILCQLLRLL